MLSQTSYLYYLDRCILFDHIFQWIVRRRRRIKAKKKKISRWFNVKQKFQWKKKLYTSTNTKQRWSVCVCVCVKRLNEQRTNEPTITKQKCDLCAKHSTIPACRPKFVSQYVCFGKISVEPIENVCVRYSHRYTSKYYIRTRYICTFCSHSKNAIHELRRAKTE